MQAFVIVLEDREPRWPDLVGKDVRGGTLEGATSLPDGTTEGKPSVAFRISYVDTDGKTKYVVAETTMALFLTAADAFRAKHGDQRS